jgi:hypothetical protein
MDASSIQKPKGISAVGLSQEEEQILFAALFAMGREGKLAWRYTDIQYAVALIVDQTLSEGEKTAQQFMQKPGQILITLGNGIADPSQGRFLLARPMSEASIHLVLQAATNFLASSGRNSATLSSGPGVHVPMNRAGGNRLIDVLHNVMEEDGGAPAFTLSGPGLPNIALSPKAKKVLSDRPWDEFKSFNFATPVTVQNVPVGDPILPRLIVDGQPMHYLLWPTGLHSGEGQLLPFLDAAKAYKLNRWPEFGTIDFTPQFLKVMSYLSKHAGTLSDVSAWAGIAREDVADLFNAAGLCGYLSPAASDDLARAPAQPTEAVHEKRGLLNRIRAKLGMAHTG